MVDVDERTGEIVQHFADLEDMAETCSLDVADRGQLVASEEGEPRTRGTSRIAALIGSDRRTVSELVSRVEERLRDSAELRVIYEQTEEATAERSEAGPRLAQLRHAGTHTALRLMSEASC